MEKTADLPAGKKTFISEMWRAEIVLNVVNRFAYTLFKKMIGND